MNWFKTTQAAAFQNFRKWKHDCRVWTAALLLLIFIHSYTKGLSDFCGHYNIKSSPWVFPFLYMQYYTKILFFLPLVLIFSGAPFMDDNQLYVLVRAGRMRWCVGQICYIVYASAIYFIFIILFSVLLNLDCMEYSSEWGKVLRTLANTNTGSDFQIEFYPEKNVIDIFTPYQAMWFTFFHSWLSGIIIGLTIFLFNIKLSGSGTFAAAFIIVLNAAASKNIFLTRFSPVSWSTLNCIQLKINDGLPGHLYVSVLFFIIISVLTVCILFVSGKYDIDNIVKIS